MQIFEVFGDLIFRDENTRERLREISSSVDRVQQNFQGLATNLNLIGNNMIGFGKTLIDRVSKPILNVAKDSVFLASDLEEAFNVVNVTFGKSADDVTEWSTQLLDSFGLVQLEAINYVGSMGAMLKSSGISATAARLMSKRLVELTGDMSSFYNLSHEETWEKIRSGISGETEPLKALGINMSVANLEAYALSQGIKTAWKEMDQGEQVALRYSYLMSVTSDAQGDFSRTSDGFANKLRILQGRFTKLKTELGDRLLPVVNIATDWFMKISKVFDNMPTSVQNAIFAISGFLFSTGPLTVILGGVVVAIGAVVAAVGTIGLPVLGAIAAFSALAVESAVVTAVIGFVGTKTGILQKAFFQLKSVVSAVVLIFKKDMSGAMDILTKKMGFSNEKASIFIGKVVSLKLRIKQVIDVVKNITKLLGMIFSGKSQGMVDLLMKKFNMTALEAVHFKAEAEKLRKKIIDLAKRFKDVAIKGVVYLADKLKQAAKWIVDHRKQIIKVIEILVKFASKIISTANTARKHFKAIKDIFDKTARAVNKASDKMVGGFKKIIDYGQKIKDKISSIKMPSWNLPSFATGVTNFTGGYAMVGEDGPELVKLPRGADVIANQKMKDVTTNLRPRITKFDKLKLNGNNSNMQNFSIIMNNYVRNDNDIDMIMDKLMSILKNKGVSNRHA